MDSVIETKSSLRKKIFLLLLFLGVLYALMTHSLPATLSGHAPRLALFLNRGFPQASVTIGEQAVKAESEKDAKGDGEPGADLNEAKLLLKQALAKDPLNSSVFRLLGQIAELQGRDDEKLRHMTMATRLSRHESLALDALFRNSLAANKPRAALYYADLLMRGDSASRRNLAPILAAMMGVDTARNAVVEKFSQNPPWRSKIFTALSTGADLSDPAAPYRILTALKEGPAPATDEELGYYIRYLVAKGYVPFAYATWLQFLSEEQTKQIAHVFNGSFEIKPSNVAFDWLIGKGTEVTAGIFPKVDKEDEHALMVGFLGQSRAAFPRIQQTIVLTPGDYRFQANYRGEMVSRRGLQWEVICYNGTKVGESEMLSGRFPKWETLTFNISIPPRTCGAQFLRLIHAARSASEQFASGTMWFDDLTITRSDVENSPTK